MKKDVLTVINGAAPKVHMVKGQWGLRLYGTL